MSKENEKKNFILTLRLYYDYLGNYTWFKEELEKNRFDVFKYLVPINSKDKKKVTIEIYKQESNGFHEEDIYIDVIFKKRILFIFRKNKTIIKKVKIQNSKMKLFYSYLKETIFETL